MTVYKSQILRVFGGYTNPTKTWIFQTVLSQSTGLLLNKILINLTHNWQLILKAAVPRFYHHLQFWTPGMRYCMMHFGVKPHMKYHSKCPHHPHDELYCFFFICLHNPCFVLTVAKMEYQLRKVYLFAWWCCRHNVIIFIVTHMNRVTKMTAVCFMLITVTWLLTLLYIDKLGPIRLFCMSSFLMLYMYMYLVLIEFWE